MRKRKAFTLIEIILATTLASIIIAVGLQMMGTTSKGFRLMDRQFDLQSDVRTSVKNMNNLLKNSKQIFFVDRTVFDPEMDLQGKDKNSLDKAFCYIAVRKQKDSTGKIIGNIIMNIFYDNKAGKWMEVPITSEQKTAGGEDVYKGTLNYDMKFYRDETDKEKVDKDYMKKVEKGIVSVDVKGKVIMDKATGDEDSKFDLSKDIYAQNVNQVMISKYATGGPDTYTAIAYTNNAVAKGEATKYAVIMVLDHSGSMNSKMDGTDIQYVSEYPEMRKAILNDCLTNTSTGFYTRLANQAREMKEDSTDDKSKLDLYFLPFSDIADMAVVKYDKRDPYGRYYMSADERLKIIEKNIDYEYELYRSGRYKFRELNDEMRIFLKSRNKNIEQYKQWVRCKYNGLGPGLGLGAQILEMGGGPYDMTNMQYSCTVDRLYNESGTMTGRRDVFRNLIEITNDYFYKYDNNNYGHDVSMMGGTNLGEGIMQALWLAGQLKDVDHKYIVVLTDGQPTRYVTYAKYSPKSRYRTTDNSPFVRYEVMPYSYKGNSDYKEEPNYYYVNRDMLNVKPGSSYDYEGYCNIHYSDEDYINYNREKKKIKDYIKNVTDPENGLNKGIEKVFLIGFSAIPRDKSFIGFDGDIDSLKSYFEQNDYLKGKDTVKGKQVDRVQTFDAKDKEKLQGAFESIVSSLAIDISVFDGPKPSNFKGPANTTP